jgi:hypothetical protein
MVYRIGALAKITAPESFSLKSNYDEVVSAIQEFRDRAVVQRARAYVDLSRIRTVSPAAALV